MVQKIITLLIILNTPLLIADDKKRAEYLSTMRSYMDSSDEETSTLAKMFFADRNALVDGKRPQELEEILPTSMKNNTPQKLEAYRKQWEAMQEAWLDSDQTIVSRYYHPGIRGSDSEKLHHLDKKKKREVVQEAIPRPAAKHTDALQLASDNLRREAQKTQLASGASPHTRLGQAMGEADATEDLTVANRSGETGRLGQARADMAAHDKKTVEQCMGDICELYRYVKSRNPIKSPFGADPNTRDFIVRTGTSVLECGDSQCMNRMLDEFLKIEQETKAGDYQSQARDYANAANIKRQIIREALEIKKRRLNSNGSVPENSAYNKQNPSPNTIPGFVLGKRAELPEHE